MRNGEEKYAFIFGEQFLGQSGQANSSVPYKEAEQWWSCEEESSFQFCWDPCSSEYLQQVINPLTSLHLSILMEKIIPVMIHFQVLVVIK